MGPGRCGFCSAAWDGDGNCPRCFHLNALEGARAAFEMSGTARRLVHALKYRFYRDTAPAMVSLMQDLPDNLQVDTFFAVPLHRSRQKSRGFNQSELLLARAGWSPTGAGLNRVRRTERQVGSGFRERRVNVGGAFAYSGPRLDGLTVAIVDDVITTGATVAECAAVLKDAGARHVWALAFARASYSFATTGPIDD
jgi:ComF family protein